MFKSIAATTDQVIIELDGVQISVPAGVSIAAALLYLGRLPTRKSQVNAAPRAPFCMMGACFECVLEVDGVSQRACQREVSNGMKLSLQMSGEPVSC